MNWPNGNQLTDIYLLIALQRLLNVFFSFLFFFLFSSFFAVTAKSRSLSLSFSLLPIAAAQLLEWEMISHGRGDENERGLEKRGTHTEYRTQTIINVVSFIAGQTWIE